MARGPTSREVMLAWRLELDATACARARALPIFETAVEDATLRALTPSELRGGATDAFTLDRFDDDQWTFVCLMHDDDWANGDGDLLAGRLARLASATGGLVVAAQSGRLDAAWRIENGAAHPVMDLRALAFDPEPDAAAIEAALDAVETALAEAPRKKRVPPAEALPALVAAHLDGVLPTPDPLVYRFAQHPRVELVFVAEKRDVVPTLRLEGAPEGQILETIGKDLDDTVARLGGDAYDGLGVQLPLFLAEHGEPVDAASLVASLRVLRLRVERIAASRRARPEVITACVDVLLAGVWDEVARKSLVLFAAHPSCPREIVERLAQHTSKSIRDACAARG